MAGNKRIIVLSEQFRGQAFDLKAEKYTVGRHEDCDICLPDPTISSHHCTLVRVEGGGFELQDAGSTNGTRVNGVRVQSQKLVNSDIVQVGAIEMLFDSDEKGDSGTASTQTGINLQNSAGTTTISEVPNFSPFGSRSGPGKGKGTWSSRLIAGAVGLLIIAAVVVLVILLMNLFVEF
ncbi:MAG: Glycogen accumulation regulator GarA [Lentisphaerae bacterium ADurb.BinA184]|nr:MAG: Glycogen accumulation regulator GarA [Lentisphaerae bacterium ADurb.BinA184]